MLNYIKAELWKAARRRGMLAFYAVLFLLAVTFCTQISAGTLEALASGVCIVLVLGMLGILLDVFGMPSTPLMLAFILGGKIESYFRMGCSYARGDLTSFVTRPISLIFILIAVWSVIGPMIMKVIKSRKAGKNA